MKLVLPEVSVLARSAWAGCALALLAAAQDAGGDVPRGVDPVQREWTVRRWALAPEEHARELGLALASTAGLERLTAVEALQRAGSAVLDDSLRAALVAALDDPHPNVRAAALAAAARADLELDASRLEALSADPWPEVRLELARWVARWPAAPGSERALAALLADADPQVVRLAQRAALQFAFAGLEPPLDLAAATRDPADLLALLEIVARGAPPGRWFGPLIESASSFEPREREARVGLILVAFGIFEGWAPATIVHGWLGTLGEDPALDERARALRLSAADVRGRRGPAADDPDDCFLRWDSLEPAVALGHAAAAADALARGRGLRSVDAPPVSLVGLAQELEALARAGQGLDDAARRFLEGALLLAGSEPSGLALALRGAGEELSEAFWHGAGSQARSWRREALVDGLQQGAPAVRAALLGALARTFARSGDLVARQALVEALAEGDPTLRRIAFGALARAQDPRPFASALAEAWRGEDVATRLSRLRELPRGIALDAFRWEFVELIESGLARGPEVLELLRPFGPDPELAARVETWCERELALLEAERAALGDDPAFDFAPRAGRPPESEREGRTKALVALYAALAGDAGRSRLDAWLGRAEPVSLEVAKVLVNLLARGPQGREWLVPWLEPPRRARLRIEAALGLLGEREARLVDEDGVRPAPELAQRAVDVLVERYPTCDQPLRARILGALGGWVHLDAARERLIGTALAQGYDGAERLRALDALGSASRAGLGSARRDVVEAALSQVLAASPDLDVRRSAVEALGRSGGERAQRVLEELAALAPGVPRREHLDDVLLPARARIGRAPGLEREVWAAPRAAAEEELRARFTGRRLSSREFDYRAELEAAVHLAAAGRLESLLAADRWWELDARFLLMLGERLLLARDAAVRARAADLVRAARIGLEGEGPAPDREQLRVAARARGARMALEGARPADALDELEDLLLAWRLAELGPRQLFAPLGPLAPEEGHDPLAWLEASVLQARAHAALDRVDPARARALARAAGERLGASGLARSQQERLLARLAR